MYKYFLVWRYLSRRMISLLAVLLLAVSLAVLVVAPSIMAGFQTEFQKRIRGTQADLVVYAASPYGVREDNLAEGLLASMPNVVATAPYAETPAIDRHYEDTDYCLLRGVIPEREAEVNEFDEYLCSDYEILTELLETRANWAARRTDPEERARRLAAVAREREAIEKYAAREVDHAEIYELLRNGDPADPGIKTCLAGIYFLRYWHLKVGDSFVLTTATGDNEKTPDTEFKIVGAFATGFSEKDRRGIVMHLDTLQDFVGVQGRIKGYALKLDDFDKAAETKQAIRSAIREPSSPLNYLWTGPGYNIKTWEEFNQNLLQAVRIEKLLIRLILFLIVLAASASIAFVLFISVYTKMRELGVLKAMGATPGGVLTLFVGQGLLIATVSMALGFGIGALFSTYINEIALVIESLTGWHPFPSDVYYLERIPSELDAGDNAVNFLVTLTLGAVFAAIPGTLGALRPPLKSIRAE